MIQLTSRIWVDAYLTRLRLADIPAFVTSHGDDTAGAVMVKLNTLDGNAKLFQKSFNLLEDTVSWTVLIEGSERDVDASISRQGGFDPDLWVIEVEDRQGRTLLDTEGLA